MQLIEFENQVNNNEGLQASREQLPLLEAKIMNQQKLLKLFAFENNITSPEWDENRVLSQTKYLGVSLDENVAEQGQVQTLLHSLNRSIESGQNIIRPADISDINNTRDNQHLGPEE